MARLVVLVCGPPGAGKTTRATTLARLEGLNVYDIDLHRWHGDERAFRRDIARLRTDPDARAVVIRSGARIRHRERWSRAIAATRVETLATPAGVCRDRIVKRNRDRPPLAQQLAAVDRWHRDYEPDPPGPATPRYLRDRSDDVANTPPASSAVCVPATPPTPDHARLVSDTRP